MKRLLIAILIVSMVQGVFAQKIEIKGTIRNATDNEATEFVNVVLQTTDSVFVNGVSTNNNGSFIFRYSYGRCCCSIGRCNHQWL